MDELDISRRSLLKKSSVAGVSGGLFGKGSFGLSGNNGKNPFSDLEFEYLEGREKWALVSEVVNTDKFSRVYEELRNRGWFLSYGDIEAFSIKREVEYEGVLMGFNKASAAEGTEAHFMHLQGDLPDSVERTTFGHIGRITDRISIQGEQHRSVEEEYILPSDDNSVTTETQSVNPTDLYSESNTEIEATRDETCTICYQSCRIEWPCALKIVAAGLGVIACSAGILLSGGWIALICIVPMAISIWSAFRCVNNRDCDTWTRRRISRSEYERKDPTDGEVSFEAYCEEYSCDR